MFIQLHAAKVQPTGCAHNGYDRAKASESGASR